MLRQCCKCRKIWKNHEWVFPRLAELFHRDVSHCYCESCFQQELEKISGRGGAARSPFLKTVERILR